MIGKRVGVTTRTDELVAEAVDDPQLDRRTRHDVIQLPFDVRERKGTREHPLRPVVERDRDREDDRLCPERAAGDEDGADPIVARDRGSKIVAISDAHAVRGRRKARDVPAIGRGQGDRQPVRVVLDDRAQDRVDRVRVGSLDGAGLCEGMKGGEVAGHEAVGGAPGGPNQCEAPGLDTLAAGLSLLADDCGLDQDQREEGEGDDCDDPQPLSRERPRGGVHALRVRAVAPLLHGFGDRRFRVARWLRSRR